MRQPANNDQTTSSWEAPLAGAVLVGPGIASIVRIPVPGTQGLVLGLRPPPRWKGSTSTVFIQNAADKKFGKPYLRLDYGPVKGRPGLIAYHWNIEGKSARQTFPNITNHMLGGTPEKILYNAAKAFRIGGRVFIVTGAIADGISILQADRPWRRGMQVVSAWAAAEMLAGRTGMAGAEIGTGVEPGLGTAIGGFTGAVAGGFIGYFAGSRVAGFVYDWAEDTKFTSAREVPVPNP